MAADSPELSLIEEGNDQPLDRYGLSSLGNHIGGNLARPGSPGGVLETAAGHFTIDRGETWCVLKPLKVLSLNGRDLDHAVLLANGDEIKAGDSVFHYSCPDDGSFPCWRVADSFWVMNSVPEGWLWSPETGIYRRHDNGIVENYTFNQDKPEQETLEAYVDAQLTYFKVATGDFATRALQAPVLYSGESVMLHHHEFSLNQIPVSQFQYFVMKKGDVGIATWTPPPEVARQNDAELGFINYLQTIYFG